MVSTEKIIEDFPHPTITPIVGQPYLDTLQGPKFSLSTNAVSVISYLVNDALGLLWLCVSDAVFDTLSRIPNRTSHQPGSDPRDLHTFYAISNLRYH